MYELRIENACPTQGGGENRSEYKIRRFGVAIRHWHPFGAYGVLPLDFLAFTQQSGNYNSDAKPFNQENYSK
jgi:hypothetical protein